MKTKTPTQPDLLRSADENWPPDPATLDLSDGSLWLVPKQAAYLARTSERTMWRHIRDHDISVKHAGRVYVSRRRLFEM